MNLAVVVPTIREKHILSFLSRWGKEFEGCRIFVVEDNREQSFAIQSLNVVHLSWSDIERDFGRDAWIFPRRTDCIRSYGYYKAFESGADVIVTLDDDCYPHTESFLSQHADRLLDPVKTTGWISTGSGLPTRGMPFRNLERINECVINHGLWNKHPDFDAITELAQTRLGGDFEPKDLIVPNGKYFPMCGMNLAFKRKMISAMYFLLMGEGWPFDRFGDIWCGIFVKKICDHLGFSIRSGSPLVTHERASDAWVNLIKETPGYKVNEELWRVVDSIVLSKGTVSDCYKEIANNLSFTGEYWDRLRFAMNFWAELFATSVQQSTCLAYSAKT